MGFDSTRCSWCQMSLNAISVTHDKMTFHATPIGAAPKSCFEQYKDYVKYIKEHVDGPPPAA